MSSITNANELTMTLKFHKRGAPSPRLVVPGLQPGMVIDIGERDGRAHLTIDATGPTNREDLSEFFHMLAHALVDSEEWDRHPIGDNPQA